MNQLAAFTLLLPAVAAMDAYLFMTPDCTVGSGPGGGFGAYLRCNDLRANTCCGIDTADSPFHSASIQGVRDGFLVLLSGYNGGNCTKRLIRSDNNGHSRICIYDLGPQYNYTGCDYSSGFSAKDSLNGKAGCQRPDVLGLPDGTEYDLSSLSDDSFKELLGSNSHAPFPSTASMTAAVPAACMETTKQRSRRPAYTTVACDTCRKRKSKCSGGDPCNRCREHKATCSYPRTTRYRSGRRDSAISRSTTDTDKANPVRQQRDLTNDVLSDCSGASSVPLRPESYDYSIRLGENNFGSINNDTTGRPPGKPVSSFVGVDQIRQAIEYRTVGSVGGALAAFSMETWMAVLQLWDEEVGLQYPLLNIHHLLGEINAAKQDAALPKPSPGSKYQYASDIAFLVLAILSCIKDASAVEVADPAVQELHGVFLVQVHTGSIRREPVVLLLLTYSILIVYILKAVYSFLVDREILAWRTTGTALRLLQELDFYTLDRRWSFGTGLPFAVSDADITRKSKPEDGIISSAYLNQMISYCKIASDVRKSLFSASPSAASSTSTRDFLEFRVLQWQRNLPEELRFQGSQDMFDSSKESRGEFRLRLLLYLRANQMRIVIHRKFATRSDTDTLDSSTTRTMIEVAQSTIHVLLLIARETDIYYAQHKTFNHFLETALSSLLLVLCSPAASHHSSCLTDVFMAMDFIRQLAKRSPISERLKNKLQGIQQLIFEANGQSLRPSHLQTMARDAATSESSSQRNDTTAIVHSEFSKPAGHLQQSEQVELRMNPLNTWAAVQQIPLQQRRTSTAPDLQAETIIPSPVISGPQTSQPIWINQDDSSNVVVVGNLSDGSSPVHGVSFESVPKVEGIWPLVSTDPSGPHEMDFTTEDLAIFRSPDMAEILKDYDSFFF
ncbi:transcription factor [Fusarium langsethiae]|uniref:Transcription factor n=1 Tax=Fusarium langsethiae TaxID=179993 RepID=A0A0M9EPV8_FUSLA|nr:transcription factor [Fusarium langsethiae]GKU08000.1 unnamed protein product [Fusarium langsethiae]GKU09656.1 unnamed protein product [Fusarium langsethiae]